MLIHTPGERLKFIRLKLGLTQTGLGEELFISGSYISHMENGTTRIPEDFPPKLVEYMKVPKLLLPNEAFPVYNAELTRFMHMITHGDLEEAKALQPELAGAAEWSIEPYYKNKYLLFSSYYWRAVGDMEKFENTLLLLQDVAKDFDQEQLYWYERILGVQKQLKNQYKAALFHYRKAEELSKYVSVNDEVIAINIGLCLREMGYAVLSIEYLEMAQQIADGRGGIRFYLAIKCSLAINCSRLGKIDKATNLLYDCLREAKTKKDAEFLTGGIYCYLGMVYRAGKDNDKAIENFDNAIKCAKNGSEQYIFTLCHKASALFAAAKTNEAMKCVDEGLPISEPYPLWHTWFQTLKHFATVDDKTSRDYILNIAIPCFMEHGLHLPVIDFYLLLCRYHEGVSERKVGIKYLYAAFDMQKRLIEGDLSL